MRPVVKNVLMKLGTKARFTRSECPGHQLASSQCSGHRDGQPGQLHDVTWKPVQQQQVALRPCRLHKAKPVDDRARAVPVDVLVILHLPLLPASRTHILGVVTMHDGQEVRSQSCKKAASLVQPRAAKGCFAVDPVDDLPLDEDGYLRATHHVMA